MNIVIRADASVQIGSGHVMRCLTLANELREGGAEIRFVCRKLSGNLDKIIQKHHFMISFLPEARSTVNVTNKGPYDVEWLGVSWEQDASETISAVQSFNIDWLVVDHYGIDNRWLRKLRKYVRNILVIDDLSNREFDCDILLNQTYGLSDTDYLGKVPEACKLLIGSKYSLVRPEFSALRGKAKEKRRKPIKIKRLLISLGNMDPENYTLRILKGLQNINWHTKPSIDVVLGADAPHLEVVKKYINYQSLEINLRTDVIDMEDLLLEADLAIGAGGTTSWERCCLGLPSILIQIADNQKKVINNLVKAGAAITVKDNDIESGLTFEFNRLQTDLSELYIISEQAFKITEGKGGRILASMMMPIISKHRKDVTLRYAKLSDTDLIFDWQSDPNTRKYFHNPLKPDYCEHQKWLKMKLNDSDCSLYIIEHDECPAGVVRLDYCLNKASGNEYYYVSVYIAPDQHNKGIGTIALEYISRMYGENVLHAEIHNDNCVSQYLFEKAGYVRQKNDRLYIRQPKTLV